MGKLKARISWRQQFQNLSLRTIIENTIAGIISAVVGSLIWEALKRLFPDTGAFAIIFLVLATLVLMVFFLRHIILRFLPLALLILIGFVVGVLFASLSNDSAPWSPISTLVSQPETVIPTIAPTDILMGQIDETIPTEISYLLTQLGIPVELLQDAVTGNCTSDHWGQPGERCWTSSTGLTQTTPPRYLGMLLVQNDPPVINIYANVSATAYFNSETVGMLFGSAPGIWIEPRTSDSAESAVKRNFLIGYSFPEDHSHLGILRGQNGNNAYLIIIPEVG